MTENKWQTDRDGFIQAVKDDEYAEFVLDDEVVLITDWEGDGVFDPYIVTPSGMPHEQVLEALENAPFLRFDGIEADGHREEKADFWYLYGAEIVE